MSDKDDKYYLINHGWSYTGRFPHSWRDPESKWPTNTDEALYSLADAVAIQAKRDHVELPPTPSEPQIASRIVIETVRQADTLFADAGLDALSPERMAVNRVGEMLREEIELASGRRRAGTFGTRNKSIVAATTSPERKREIFDAGFAATADNEEDAAPAPALELAETVMRILGNPGISPRTWDRLRDACAAALRTPVEGEK